MKDIWAVPPGGPVATETKRPWVRSAIAAAVITSLGLGTGGMVKWMRTSTPVDVDTALEEFRASQPESGDQDDGSDPSDGGPSSREKAEGKQRQQRSTLASSSGRSVAAPSENQGRGSGEVAPRQQENSTTDSQTQTRPREGVYTWAIDGFEEAPGTRRQLPERSHRVITHGPGLQWTEHHIFSEQKEQWFGLEMTTDGVVTRSVRNRVVIGPVTNDKTIDFNPPMFVSRFPFEVGDRWEGEWKGRTSGEYRARCFEHTTMTIGGERVEVWATEVKMTMRGEIEGTTTVRSWVAPEHVLVVKQYQETEVSSGPADYYSEWSGEVTSLDPQR